MGMVEEIHNYCNREKRRRIIEAQGVLSETEIDAILAFRPRTEKVAVKDVKLRTFITEDAARKDMVAHVYDITYGSIRAGLDNLVVIDDSIVRGTTLRESILRILDRLGPKKIVLVSSAPQIRYPDCYGIDMAKLGDLIAFRAAVALLRERGRSDVLENAYKESLAQIETPSEPPVNCVRKIYEPFTTEEISDKIAELLRPPDCKAEIRILYQRIENLHAACPNHRGDWYFTGRYPTPGGHRVANRALINFVDGVNQRAY
jgi:amidophosphoribosyltransferase